MALSKIDVANMLTGLVPNDNTIRRPNSKPIIINGDMTIAQRDTSATGKTSSGYYTCDRIQFVANDAGTHTVIQETSTSGNAYANGFAEAYRIDCTTADASVAADSQLFIKYKVEGRDAQVFKKGTANAEKFTLAFWVKSNKTGTGQVNLRDEVNTRQCSATYTISSANTWEHKICNFAADTTGALPSTNAEGFGIEWYLAAGSNFTSGTAPTAWEAISNADSAASLNLAISGSTDNDFSLTGVQLEVGEYTSSTLPPFQFESFGDNLARCQRYYYRINPDADAQASIGEASYYSSSAAFVCLEFPIAMRDSPSLEQTTGTDYFNLNRNSANDSFDSFNNLNASDHTSAHLYISSGISGTAGHGGRCRFNDASARLAFSAEL
jgi:hypothetical protein